MSPAKAQELEPEIAARKEALARGERNATALKPLCTQPTLDLIASFQRAVVEDLVTRTIEAAQENSVKSILVTGGVAANRDCDRGLRRRQSALGWKVISPAAPFRRTTPP